MYYKTPSLIKTLPDAIDWFTSSLVQPVDETTCNWLGWITWPIDLTIGPSVCKMKPKEEL